MPGPISDGYDPIFGTTTNAAHVKDAIRYMHTRLGDVIGSDVIPILNIVKPSGDELDRRKLTATLTEREWRVLRFACELASDSI